MLGNLYADALTHCLGSCAVNDTCTATLLYLMTRQAVVSAASVKSCVSSPSSCDKPRTCLRVRMTPLYHHSIPGQFDAFPVKLMLFA